MRLKAVRRLIGGAASGYRQIAAKKRSSSSSASSPTSVHSTSRTRRSHLTSDSLWLSEHPSCRTGCFLKVPGRCLTFLVEFGKRRGGAPARLCRQNFEQRETVNGTMPAWKYPHGRSDNRVSCFHSRSTSLFRSLGRPRPLANTSANASQKGRSKLVLWAMIKSALSNKPCNGVMSMTAPSTIWLLIPVSRVISAAMRREG